MSTQKTPLVTRTFRMPFPLPGVGCAISLSRGARTPVLNLYTRRREDRCPRSGDAPVVKTTTPCREYTIPALARVYASHGRADDAAAAAAPPRRSPADDED